MTSRSVNKNVAFQTKSNVLLDDLSSGLKSRY